MKASEIQQELIHNYQVRLPSFIWGSPGIGKSALIKQTTDLLKIGFIDLRVASMDPVDLSGLPAVDHETRTTYWNIPQMLPNVERDGEAGYLVMDELTSAVPLMQAGCYRLVQEGKVGDYTMPPGWVVVAAGNLASDNAVVFRQSSALASRFGHYDMEVDKVEFIEWGRANGIDEDVLAFIEWRPELLHKMDIEDEEHSFPTPRTWEYVSRHKQFMTPDNEFNKVRAFVGQATAIEFNAFMRVVRNLTTIDQIIQNPMTAEVSPAPDVNNAMVSLLTQNVTPDNFSKLMQYSDRLPEEFQATFTFNAIAKDETLAFTPEFIGWAKKNAGRLRA